MVKSRLHVVLVALAKGLALLTLLYGYVNLNVRGSTATPPGRWWAIWNGAWACSWSAIT